MRDKIIWKLIEKEDGRKVNMPFMTCKKCEKEYTSGNVFASKYCPECSEEIKKEKTRERVRKHREKAKKQA